MARIGHIGLARIAAPTIAAAVEEERSCFAGRLRTTRSGRMGRRTNDCVWFDRHLLLPENL